MARKRILWFCSWYPGITDPFNGDFIQRHARAAAVYNDIHVIHVIQTDSPLISETIEEYNTSPGLTELIIYIKRKNTWLGRLKGYMHWATKGQKAIYNQIGRHGKPDLAHVQVPWKAGLFALMLKRRYGLQYVVTEHWGIYNDVEKLNYAGRSRQFKLYTKKIFDHAAAFVPVSRYIAEGVNRLVTTKAYTVVPNVVDTDLFFPVAKEDPPFRFIHVSNMVPLKNAEGILEAFAKLLVAFPGAELVMVGDKNPAIHHYATTLGLQSPAVQFRGEVPYAQVAKEMQSASCLVLFSNIENSPCVIGEALCCGLPVISTNVGGIPELVNDGNAILIEAGNTAGLTTAMETMIRQYPQYDTKKIAEDAKSKFSYGVIGKKLDEIYTSISGKD